MRRPSALSAPSAIVAIMLFQLGSLAEFVWCITFMFAVANVHLAGIIFKQLGATRLAQKCWEKAGTRVIE